MIAINDVISANAALEAAFENLAVAQAIAKPKNYHGMSFAMEEAGDDGVKEAKKGIFQKLMEFIKRFFDFILGRGERSADAAEATHEKAESFGEKLRNKWAKKSAPDKDTRLTEITTTYLARIQDVIVEDLTTSLSKAKAIQRLVGNTVTVRDLSHMVEHTAPLKQILDIGLREVDAFRNACSGSEDGLIDYIDKPAIALKTLPTTDSVAKFSGDLTGITDALILAIGVCKTNVSRYKLFCQQLATARSSSMEAVDKATKSGNDSMAANLRTALIERLSPIATHVHMVMMTSAELYTEITNLEVTLMRIDISPKFTALREEAIEKHGGSLSKDKHLAESLVRTAFKDAVTELLG